MDNKNEEFKFFTYEEYNKILDYLLFNVWKKTYIDIEDLKQDLFIFIVRLENKISKNIDNIRNPQGYIMHCLKFKTKEVVKNFFKIVSEDKLDLLRYEEIIPSDLEIENKIVNKLFLEEIFKHYNLKKEDIDLLLGKRDNAFRNERYLLNRFLKKNIKIKEKEKWIEK